MTALKKQPEPKRKPVNEKYRVKPNLSLRGRDIMQRLNNGTLPLNKDGQYTLDPKYAQMKGKSKIDHARDFVEESIKIENLKNKLNEPSRSKT